MRIRSFVCAAAAALVFVAAPALAQQASLTGVVSDSTKAVLPGVTVTITNVETGVPSVAVTDETGVYRVPRLAPGVYSVQAELSGFGTIVIEGVNLLVGQNASIPIALSLAALNETLTVTVTGEAPCRAPVE